MRFDLFSLMLLGVTITLIILAVIGARAEAKFWEDNPELYKLMLERKETIKKLDEIMKKLG